MNKISIIGGGIAGLSAAIQLAREGVRVAVYESEYPGYGASGKSAGILVTIMPEELLDYPLESLEIYRSLPESTNNIWRVRALWINKNPGCMDKLVKVHNRKGLDSVIIDADEATRVAGFSMRTYSGEGYALVREFVVDIGWAINAMVQEASRLGVDIISGRVVREGDVFKGPGGRIDQPIIIAGGAWSLQLLPGLKEYLVTYRCQMATIEGARPARIIEDDALHYYIVPVSPSRSNIGNGANTLINDPHEGFNPDQEDIYDIIERYAERNPDAWNAGIVSYWAAPCNTSGDSLPIADRLDSLGEVYVLTGFNGAGLTMAPSTSKRLVHHLLYGDRLPGIFRLSSSKKTTGLNSPPEPYEPC
ncbi:MAG: FAD-binding oxidoreductase [Desulfurococcales archaeon]|nr:FAD-binding oxidoreductase [Desulfurococcales archaeon]